MIQHIVLWNLKDKTRIAENSAVMKERLEALVGVVPGLVSARAGAGFGGGFDVALVAELESREALDVYQSHPAHCAVKEFVHSVAAERVCCDFEF